MRETGRRTLFLSRVLAVFAGLLVQCCGAGLAAADFNELVLDTAETSGIDGREWNRIFPGQQTVDAVHRSVLLRFPGAPEIIRARIAAGGRIKSAEIVLDYAGYELVPKDYTVRSGQGKDAWQKDAPTWHILAVPLRQPWRADATVGPTYTSRIAARAPWAELGAASQAADRFPVSLPPAELSTRSPVGHIDISALLTSDVLAADLGVRLRLLEECGFLLTKLEAYDSRYRIKGDVYEWAVPTGGHGLSFAKPRLVVRFEQVGQPGAVTPPTLPRPVGFAQMAGSLPEQPLRKPDWEDLAKLEALRPVVRRLIDTKPAWMSDVEFAHARQLLGVGGDTITGALLSLSAGDPKPYQTYMMNLWRTPPRYWKGWGIQDDLILSRQLGDLTPDVVKQHIAGFWRSWLMPDIATKDLFHPQSDDAYNYIVKSGDWRGRASFFRGAYNLHAATQNFNNTAAVGALLGGTLIGSEAAVADGRNGLDKVLLRFWSFTDGSSQEILDHYYLSVTLSAQKLLADFGPTAFDRLAGRITLERTLEMLATLYHPELKRLVGPTGRGRLSGVLVEQDGIYGALHVLSRKGAVRYADQPFKTAVSGMQLWGHDFPPGRVGLQSLTGPWAPSWFARTIDDKRFPFSETSAETIRNNFNPPLWRRSYLGRHYGLASQDLKGGVVDFLAQWARDDEASRSMQGLGTLTLRYCVNACDMVATRGGTITPFGTIATFQNKNRAIVATRPPTDKAAIDNAAGAGGLSELASVIALWNFAVSPSWELYVDGQRRQPGEEAIRVKAGQLITLKDGRSFLAIRPLPATDLGRGGEEVVIRRGGYGGKPEGMNASIEPALTIASYNLKREGKADPASLDWEKITTGTVSGFVIELGDAAEYKDFAAFQAHARSATLETVHDAAGHAVDVRYVSGGETMTARFGTDVPQQTQHFPLKPGTQGRAIQDRRVNGQAPYLAAGLERDTSWSQQGTSGRLEKNGAILETERGHKAYLIADQEGAGVLAYNPIPDPTTWQLTLPGGGTLKADGRVGLLRVAYDREARTLDIEHAAPDPKQAGEIARTMSVAGLPQPLTIKVCGKAVEAAATSVNIALCD